MRVIAHINKNKIKHFILVFIIALNFSACATLDKYLTLFLQSGMISVENKSSSSSASGSISSNDIASTSTAKKADRQTSAMMDELYKGILGEVKECQSLNDKFGECAAAEYNNGKIYKILVYSKREVGIGIKTLQEGQGDLDTGLIYCNALDELCEKMSFKDGAKQRQTFQGVEALKAMREYFEMDMSF